MSSPPSKGSPPEKTLKQLQEAGTLSHFASSIAHEVCNPLSQIVLATDFLAGPRPLNDDMRKKIVGYLRQGAERIDTAMKSMLRTYSPIETSMTSEDANDLINSALASVIGSESVTINRHFSSELPPVLVDRKHMTDAIANLCTNAIEAMQPGGGTLSLTTTAREFAASEREGWQRQSWFRAGDIAVVVEITDTGRGIQPAKLGLVFEPFFTTKAAGLGAGLGLTVAKKIVDLHHGRLEIANCPEGGVKATLTLKAASPSRPDQPHKP